VGLRCRQRMGTAVRDNGTTQADGRRGLLPSVWQIVDAHNRVIHPVGEASRMILAYP